MKKGISKKNLPEGFHELDVRTKGMKNLYDGVEGAGAIKGQSISGILFHWVAVKI